MNLSENTFLKNSLSPLNVLVVLLFFFNTTVLPHGLTLSFFCAPFFLFILVKYRYSIKLLLCLCALLILFDTVHFAQGIILSSFIKSNVLFLGTIISFVTSYHYFKLKGESLSEHFKQLVLFNTFFVVLAIITLFFPYIYRYFWSDVSMGHDVDETLRLQLFSPEPSHYALLLVPLVIYYLFTYLQSDKKLSQLLPLILVSIPFFLTFSFGNFVVLCLSVTLTIILFYRTLIVKTQSQRLVLYTLCGLTMIALVAFFILPEHFIQQRIQNVLSGKDTSANGRTFQSFGLAWHLAKLKSGMWGIGLGQIKELATPYYRDFFPYITYVPDPVRIPNSNAEVLATFGLVGLTLKLVITTVGFIILRLYRNAYTTTLFIFIFVFQFMGSYLINFTEILFWGLIFANPFKKFAR